MKTFRISYVWTFLPKLLGVLPITLMLLFASILLSLVLGSLFLYIRTKKIPILSQIVRVIISFVRGTPVITQLFLVYFSLPMILKTILNIDITRVSGIYFVIFTYGLHFGAAVSENLRASIASVGEGQIEAACSIGMSEYDAFRRIISPQMFVVALPNFANIFVGALKNTSLAFSVGVMEMMSRGQILGSTTLHYMEAYVALAIIYYVLYIILITIFNKIETRVNKHLIN